MDHSRPLFLCVRLFNTVFVQLIINIIRQWLNSKRGSLGSNATTLPTAPQPLPVVEFLDVVNWSIGQSVILMEWNEADLFIQINFESAVYLPYIVDDFEDFLNGSFPAISRFNKVSKIRRLSELPWLVWNGGLLVSVTMYHKVLYEYCKVLENVSYSGT